ncbi:MAG: prx-2 [Fibrobacteria bacterium]|jgi:peroxiredoxin (alkyl hydroperoxide reductase subunit C)|nr:prx-2 [Fibrobacteria bacterium]
MSFIVTKPAPVFKAKAVLPNGTFGEIDLASFRGKHVFLYFYPLAFTFVCPTEILAFDKRIADFKAKGVEVIGVSVDSVHTLAAWRNTPVKEGGIGAINHPVVADLNKQIARDYGILFEEEVALRGQFLIDKEGVVRHALVNDLPLGRSVDEALRTIDALQFFEENGEVCPANWHKGDEAIRETRESVGAYLAKTAS